MLRALNKVVKQESAGLNRLWWEIPDAEDLSASVSVSATSLWLPALAASDWMDTMLHWVKTRKHQAPAGAAQ